VTRAGFLAVSGGVALAALHGAARADAPADVNVAYAGSLVTLMERSVGPAFSATGYAFHGQAKGSSALANLMRDGLIAPDVFVSADTASLESLRGTEGHDVVRWYATFAATRLQIAYSANSAHATAFADVASGKLAWYDVLGRGDVRIARTDPAQDPKGYRVLLALELAEAFYHRPDLGRRILGDAQNPDQILPEETALARLETGDIDGLWVYSVEATSRNLPVLELPPQINLGDPAHAAEYARATVTVGARTYRGAPIVYALSVPAVARNPAGGAAFVAFLFNDRGRALQTQAGLTPLPGQVVGDRNAIPASLQPVFR